MKYRVIKDFYPLYEQNDQYISEIYLAQFKENENSDWIKMTDFFVDSEKAIEYVNLKSNGEICIYEKEVNIEEQKG